MKIAEYKNGILTYKEVADPIPTAEELREMNLAEISSLKEQLAESDYKVVKNAECLALGIPFPYNAEELHVERQAIRDRINELEASL